MRRRPGERTGDVDRTVLPHPTAGAAEPADVETVEPHQLAGMVGLDMAGREPWWRCWSGGRRVAGDQAGTPF